MRLIQVTLRDFRGIKECTVDFHDGITIVEGANEAGKSSIAEAIRLIRTAKASSKHRDIMSIQPVGCDVGPEVVLKVRSGAYTLTYHKRWLKRPVTELTVDAPAPQQFTGDEAHERFLAILKETVDTDLLRAQDVVQGESLEQPVLAHINALQAALNDSADALDGHDVLMGAIDTEYATYFTPTGKPTGEYKAVAEQVAAFTTQVADLGERSAEMDRFTDDHATSVAVLTRLTREAGAAAQSLASAEARTKEIDGLRHAADAAQRELAQARQAHDAACTANEARAKLVAEAASRAETVTEIAAMVRDCAEGDERRRAEYAAAQTVVTAAQERQAAARDAARAANDALERRRARAERADLAARVGQAREVAGQRVSAAAVVADCVVDEATLAHLVALDTEMRVADGARDAAAAQVSVQVVGGQPVIVDGQAVPQGQTAERSAVGTVRIDAPGLLTVEVRPGAAPAELDKQVTRARTALDQALRDAGVASVDEARHVAERRRANQTLLDRADATLRMLLGDATLEAFEERIAALDARLARDCGTVDDDAGPGSGAGGTKSGSGPAAVERAALEQVALEQEAVERAAVERAVDDARDAEKSAEDALGEAEGTLQRCRTASGKAREELVRAQASLVAATAERDRAATTLAEARAQNTDEALESAVEQANAQVREAAVKATTARETLDAADPDLLEMQLKNAQDLVARKEQECADVRKRVHELEALLNDRASEGIYDKLTGSRAALQAADVAYRRLDRAAKAVNLLRATMRRHRDEAQQKYVAPFKERIEALGRIVYGRGFAVQVSRDLVIESRTQDGVTVPFDALSVGAKEQIALLGRLACAQLVDADNGAPVILDDTLGFSDPNRLAALNLVLNKVGETAQVVLLTCQPERFAAVGGAKVVRL